jgi:hypothetical protein
MENKEDNFYKDVKKTGEIIIVSIIFIFLFNWLNSKPIRWVYLIIIFIVAYYINKHTGYQYQILDPGNMYK